jgi:tetratricopeptide (TPR) repeat protein
MAATGFDHALELIASGNTLEGLRELYELPAGDPLASLNRVLYAPGEPGAEDTIQDERERLLGRLAASSGRGRAVVLHNLGCLCLAQDEIAEARVHFRNALAAAEDYLPSRHNLAHAADILAEEDDARVLYYQVLDADPALALSRVNLALIDLELGQRESGLAALRTLVGEQPANPTLALHLCRGLLASGNPPDAAEVLTIIGAIGGWERFPDLRECYAFASLLLNERAEAESMFRGLLAEDDNNQFARTGLMRILAAQEAWPELATHAETLHAATPTGGTAELLRRMTAAGMISA